MTRYLIMWGVLLLGCYDLTFDDAPHVITDLEILAIHAEPPVVHHDKPIHITVLFADPHGNGQPVKAAWRVQYFKNPDENPVPAADRVVPPTREDMPGILIAPPSHLKKFKKGEHPTIGVRLFLCRGRFTDLAAIKTQSDDALLPTLCENGPLAHGVKAIRSNEVIAVPALFGVPFEPPIDINWTQRNPRIQQLWIDGTAITAIEEGGGTYPLCVRRHECDNRRVHLNVMLAANSLDKFSVSVDATPAQHIDLETYLSNSSEDAGVSKIEYHESHRIDWYVTGGSLLQPSSFLPIPHDEMGEEAVHGTAISSIGGSDFSGTFQTKWYLPRNNDEFLTLYVVARDERGGNDWRTYRISLGTAP